MSEQQKDNSKLLALQLANELKDQCHFISLKDTEELFVYVEAGNLALEHFAPNDIGIYVPAEPFVKSYCENKETGKEFITTHLCNEVINHIVRERLKDREIFDCVDFIHFNNTCLDLATLEQRPFNWSLHSLAKIPVDYNPDLGYKNSRFWQFLNEIQSEDNILFIQEQFGACLAKSFTLKKFCVWIGEPGTGKTTTIAVLEALLGRQRNVSNLSMQELSDKNPFFTSKLYGKLANIRDDLPRDVVQSTGMIKQVTSGASINAQYKYKPLFSFRPYCFFLFTCNELPPLKEDDLGFFDRFSSVLFERRWGGKDAPDLDLERKLTTPEELSQVLNFAIEGLKRLRAKGMRLDDTKTEELRLRYRKQSLPVWAFSEECLEEDSEGTLVKDEGWKSFMEYVKREHLPNVGRERFFKEMREYRTVTDCQVGGRGERRRAWRGIKLKESVTQQETYAEGKLA